MSVQAITWARSKRTGSPARKAVLMALADRANEELGWSTFVGQKRLADETELSRRTVIRALADLERMGAIRREERHDQNGFRTTDLIYLCPDWNPDGEPVDNRLGATVSPPTHVTLCPRLGDTVSQQVTQVEPKSISGGTDENAGSSTGSAPPPPEDECSIDQWAARFALTPKLEPEIAAVLRARQELAGAADTIDRLWDLHERVHRLHASELRQALARPYVPSWSRTS